jgi:hypothetical protein
MNEETNVTGATAGVDTSVLPEQTRQLYVVLAEKAPKLAQMLYGIWLGLNDVRSPETLPQVAHSARELMEKAPIYLEVPVEQGSGTLTGNVRTLHAAWQSMRAGAWAGCPPWEGAIDPALAEWLATAGDFFDGFATAHQTRAQQIQIQITSLDQSGQPLPEGILSERVRQWDGLRQYFLKVAHHNSETDVDTLRQKVGELEVFLLALLYPQPIADMDDIDELIQEGEALA